MREHGPQRALRNAWLAVGWIGVAIVIVLSLIPSPPTFTAFPQEDKLQHVLAYGALMLWFAQIRQPGAARAISALALLALGIGLEFVQGWLGTRTFSVADMAADAVGVALGWAGAPPRGPNLFAALGRMLIDLR